MSLMKGVYQAFLNQGLSPNQAKIVTAEVGRENDFQPQYLFGRHVDASNGKVNLGMISWQGGRGAALDKRLRSKGLVGGNGIVRSQAALNEMANFLVGEIQTNPAYAPTKKAFLNNPNVTYDVGKKVLGQNFIRWDYSGKAVLGANVGKHHAKRDKYYRQLGGQGGSDYQPQQGGQQQAPDPRLSMSAPQLLATLRKGKDKRSDLQILYELSNNNGRAGHEIKQLMAQGENISDIASQLGLKVPNSQPQASQQAIEPPSFEQFSADYKQPTEPPSFEEFIASTTEPVEPPSFEEFSASYGQEQTQEPVEPPSFEQFAASYEPTEQPTQAGETWQTQNESSGIMSSPNNEKAQPMLKSSWESLS